MFDLSNIFKYNSSMNLRLWHRYIALFITTPLILIVITGLILQVRNQFEWIQPKTEISTIKENIPLITLEEVINKTAPDVDQIIYRPGKNNLSVRLKNGTEIQLHPQTGQIMKSSPRRTGFLIDLHQGSWMGPLGQYFVHLSTGLGLIFLIISGFILWPFWRWRKI